MAHKNPESQYKIRFSDCDMFGHLNNSRYLDYFINAREDHLKDAYQFDFERFYTQDQAWVISGHEIAYIRPAKYNEFVNIQSTLLAVEREMLFVEMIMMNQEKTQLKAIMRSRLVPVQISTGRKQPHGPEFMLWAKSIENTEIDSLSGLQDRIRQIQNKVSV